jgi:hypothetical protein
MDKEDIKKEVRERYARVVTQDKSCGCIGIIYETENARTGRSLRPTCPGAT